MLRRGASAVAPLLPGGRAKTCVRFSSFFSDGSGASDGARGGPRRRRRRRRCAPREGGRGQKRRRRGRPHGQRGPRGGREASGAACASVRATETPSEPERRRWGGSRRRRSVERPRPPLGGCVGPRPGASHEPLRRPVPARRPSGVPVALAKAADRAIDRCRSDGCRLSRGRGRCAVLVNVRAVPRTVSMSVQPSAGRGRHQRAGRLLCVVVVCVDGANATGPQCSRRPLIGVSAAMVRTEDRPLLYVG